MHTSPTPLGKAAPLLKTRSLKTSALGLATLAALGLAAARPAQAQTTINTIPDQIGPVSPFGVPNSATYGETVTVPTNGDSVLQDFAFNVNNNGGVPITADAEVYAWTGTTATGPALFQSVPFTITANGTFTQYTAIPNVSLTSGGQYVLLFTTSGLQAGQSSSSAQFGRAPDASYGGGNFVFLNNGDDRSQLTGGSYFSFGEDLAFRADFGPAPTATPEPSSVAAFAFTGLGAMGLILRARKRRAA